GWKLSEKGVEGEVVESHSYVGGYSHTIQRDGYLFDLGPHRFHTDNPAVLAEVERLTGKLPQLVRKTRVYFMGNYFDYPLTAGNLLSSLPPTLGILCFGDFLTTWLRNRVWPTPDDSFESWVVNRFGRRLYDIYFGPYTAKVWGRDPSRLSASWAAQRVAVVDLWDLVTRLLGFRRGYNNFHHSPYKLEFQYPRMGVGYIYQRMAEEILRQGGVVSLDSTVREVTHSDGHVQGVIVERDGSLKELAGDYFVSTIPIPDLVRALRPCPPDDVLAAAETLKYRAMVFLFLTIDRESVTDDHWIYFPEGDVVFNRISEMKNFTPDAAPQGKTSLTVEISCEVNDEVWNTPDALLYDRSIQGLEGAGLIRADQVIDHFFVRASHAYPTYHQNFEVALGRLAYHLAGLDNLIVCGRQGLFRYINQDHAIEMGLCAAEDVLTQPTASRVGRVGAENVYFG
ncbi:MAG TPA: FAD-dependent oxidoreductase, partial [Chloroflexota bacterium]|nr:FAD-dependent oxidoreductase [Chloroflexota bacterium]